MSENTKSFYRNGADVSFAKDAEITAIEDTMYSFFEILG